MPKSVVVVELREQLLVRERGLDEREDTLLAREHGVVEAECALGRACMECDVIHDQDTTILEDYQVRVSASTTSRWHSLEFDRVLSGRQFILSMQEVDLEWQEEKLAKD
jgi:hypothetical protein